MSDKINVYGICLSFAVFSIIWLSLAVIYTFLFQIFVNTWFNMEILSNNDGKLNLISYLKITAWKILIKNIIQ